MINVLRFLLFPFALLYGIGVVVRSLLYKFKILKPIRFDIPTIALGNLNVGGTGKTPFIEYLLRMFDGQLQAGVLSRGYRRQTHGYIMAGATSTIADIGDEPFQIKTKFPHISVVVCEQRVLGIPRMVSEVSKLDIILLDDAFQHRALEPGLSILLTEYGNLFSDDFLLPVGRLREWRVAYKRAQIIVVTKCPLAISEDEKKQIIKKIKPEPGQNLFFSYLNYGKLNSLIASQPEKQLNKNLDVVLFCGIADPSHIFNFLKEFSGKVELTQFSDHHNYTIDDLTQMKFVFDKMKSSDKILVTTDKDVGKLSKYSNYFTEHRVPIYSLPIEVDLVRLPSFASPQQISFDEKEKLRFEHLIYENIRSHNYHP